MSDINSEMKAVAEYAIRSAKEKFDQDLDFSDKSIEKLDTLLDQAYQSFSNLPRDEQTSKAISQTANMWGSFLGEFMRQKWVGTWILEGSVRLVSINNIEFSPLVYVYKKISSNPEYSVQKYLIDVGTKVFLSSEITSTSQNQLEEINKQIEFNRDYLSPRTNPKNKNILYILFGTGGVLLLIAGIIAYLQIKTGGNLLSLLSDPHKEEINRGIALELVKDKTHDQLNSIIPLCMDLQRYSGRFGDEAQAGCTPVEIWAVAKAGNNEYTVSLQYDVAQTGSYFYAMAKYVYGDEIGSGAIFRVLLDNNAVLPENPFAESLVR